MAWREAIDWAIREYRGDLGGLRRYDLEAERMAEA